MALVICWMLRTLLMRRLMCRIDCPANGCHHPRQAASIDAGRALSGLVRHEAALELHDGLLELVLGLLRELARGADGLQDLRALRPHEVQEPGLPLAHGLHRQVV